MPNWTVNCLELSHPDATRISALVAAFSNEKLLDYIEPLPDGKWDYQWCIDNWGTKWDVGSSDGISDQTENSVSLNFDSAWSPPLEAYRKLVEQGYTVKAYYYEPGLAFVGKFDNHSGEIEEQYFEYGDENSDTVRDYIGEELDDFFSISENLAEWEDDWEDDTETDEEDDSK